MSYKWFFLWDKKWIDFLQQHILMKQWNSSQFCKGDYLAPVGSRVNTAVNTGFPHHGRTPCFTVLGFHATGHHVRHRHFRLWIGVHFQFPNDGSGICLFYIPCRISAGFLPKDSPLIKKVTPLCWGDDGYPEVPSSYLQDVFRRRYWWLWNASTNLVLLSLPAKSA